MYSSLKSFHLTYFGAYYFPMPNYMAPIFLINEDTGEQVARLIGEWGENFTDCYLDLPDYVTEKGHYILDIPEGAITDEFDNELPALQFRYWVDGSGNVEIPVETVLADPGDGTTVASIDMITLTFPNMISAYGDGPMSESVEVTLNGEPVETNVSYPYDYETMNASQVGARFDPPLTEAGDYEIFFPARAFNLGVDFNETRYSNEFKLTYTVVPEMGITGVRPADESELAVLKEITVKMASASYVESTEGITSVVGTLTDGIPEGESGPEAGWIFTENSPLSFTFTPVDEAGDPMEISVFEGETLYVTLPEGLFKLTSDPTQESGKLVLAYAGLETTGCAGIDADDPTIEIFTLEGIRVDRMEPGRLYIVRKGGSVSRLLKR